ncbi:MAG: hypothetical protein ACKO2N_09410 [Tabrizicola sp.]
MRTLAVAGFLAGVALLLWMAALSFLAAQERTRTYRYLSDALNPVEVPALAVSWAAPTRPLVRDFTPQDAASVGAALTQAWRAFAVASDTGETALLADHFSSVALGSATLAAEDAARNGTRMVILEQLARPQFLHLDGSVLQVTAQATTVRFALKDGALSQIELAQDEARTTLTNETTGWRVFSHERTGSRALPSRSRPAVTIPRLVGFNYYPSGSPWRRFWPDFDPKVIAADLDLVASINGNAVRIFLPVADFGPDQAGQRNLLNLQVFLDLAKARGIAVIPTLFDLKPGYRPALWADDVAYLRRVLPVLVGSSAVVLVDLKNEPDLDRAGHGAGLVDAWLTTMALMTHTIAPQLPLTIGWSSANAAPGLVDLVDAVSYHDYAEPEGTADRLAAVRRTAQGKPVLVTEIGESSYTLALGFPGSPATQATALQDRLGQLDKADGVLVWTLHDFPQIDAAAVGASPWVQSLQAQFGAFDQAGRMKPAGAAIRAAFAGADHAP